MDPQDTLIKEILKDSAELLSKTAEMTDQLQQLPALREKVAQLENANSAMLKAAQERLDVLVRSVDDFASRLVSHGSLPQEKKAAFIELIKEDPSRIVSVMEKLAGESAAIEPGHGDSDKKAALDGDENDPIVKFAMGDA